MEHTVVAGKREIKGNKPSTNNVAVMNIILHLVMLTVYTVHRCT